MRLDEARSRSQEKDICMDAKKRKYPGHLQDSAEYAAGRNNMNQEYELNKKFGEYIADSVDEVILVGAKQTKPIQDGLAKKKFPKEKIYILNDVKEAFPLMQKLKEKDTYVLLENDLPDIFNEK